MNTWFYWLANAGASTRTPVLESGFRNSREGLELAISRLPGGVSVDLGEPAKSVGGIPLNYDFVGCAISMPTEMTLETIQIETKKTQGSSLNLVNSLRGIANLLSIFVRKISSQYRRIPEI